MAYLHSILLRRDGWVALMASLGFDSALPAGDIASRPRLLSRQTVVVGISDGVVLPPAEERAPRVQLQASLPSPTQELLASVRWAFVPIARRDICDQCQESPNADA
jgi:hypothetical protein